MGVLAVDPSSPFSGGALLGDRIRMQEHATDDGVFIRSMASRGHLGGLSAAVPQALRVLDAAGYDVILLETVGVGQAEFEVASLADTTVLLLAPGMGDGIQAAKAGILEIADIFIVNKADRDGADQVARDLRHMQSLGGRAADAVVWRSPIVKTVASRAEGVDDALAALTAHFSWLHESGQFADATTFAGGRRDRGHRPGRGARALRSRARLVRAGRVGGPGRRGRHRSVLGRRATDRRALSRPDVRPAVSPSASLPAAGATRWADRFRR